MALINKLNALGDLVREKTGKHTRIEVKECIETFDIHLEVLDRFRYYFPAGTREVGVEILNRNMKMPHYKYDASDNYEYIHDLDYVDITTVRNVNDGDYFSIFNSKSSAFTGTYKFTCRDENGRVITEEKEVKNTMTLDEMATELSNVETGGDDPVIEELNITENGTYTAPEGVNGYSPVIVNVETGGGSGEELPEEAFAITGDCSYRFSGGGWDWYINIFGDKVTTSEINDMNNMFTSSQVANIPFEINGTLSKTYSMASMFNNCSQLTELPKIVGRPSEAGSMLAGCRRLREISEESVAGIDWSYIDNMTISYSGARNHMFYSCCSLRKFPMSFLTHCNPKISYYNTNYGDLFEYCYALDEVVGLPLVHREASYTSNIFNSTFRECNRLKRLTFETNEDGSPVKIDTWGKQTIDLSISVGYTGSLIRITNYNSGITTDKRVTDDATYQALKNDPDWFTTDINYSRYNHDSAVETINSLPDLSGGAGSNTIKFKGASGTNTEGGAINTMTEEEIAVATAKGWTVTFA